MNKREKPEYIDATNQTTCPFCQKKFDKGTSIRTHFSLFHKQQHKETRLLEKTARKTCRYCRNIFTRSNDCQKHEIKCQFKTEEIQQEEKRLKLKEKMGIFTGPAEVLVKVPKGIEMTTVKQRVKKLTYKLLTQPNIFEGDVRDLQMQYDIAEDVKKRHNKLYEVIMMDPPWRLKQDLPYPTQSDKEIIEMPLHLVQEEGILILWIVNSKRDVAMKLLEKNGYREVDRGEWVKLTTNGVLYQGQGKYTAHCNETFIIAVKGKVSLIVKYHTAKSVIFDAIDKHSAKPDKIYDFIQTIAPDSLNLEIFGRKSNIRRGWTTFGNNLK